MDKILTVIIPTYNMSAYLRRCLDSLLVSTVVRPLLEVLVINDGSKDNSSEIAHEYETKYPNTFRVIDKENGNYGSCINRGLKEANGKYIRVLDADDWFDTNELNKFILQLKDVDVDMILTPYNIVDNSGKITNKMNYEDISFGDIFLFQNYSNISVYLAMHSLTYRTELLRNINYVQTEGISYTDNEWVFFPQHFVQTCVYIPFIIYNYVVGREGQTIDPKVLAKNASHNEKLVRSMIKFSNSLVDLNKNTYSNQRLENQIAYLTMLVYRTCLILQDKESWDNEFLKSFDMFIYKERNKIYKQMSRLKYRKYLPIHYVRFWRATGKRFSLDWILKYIKK